MSKGGDFDFGHGRSHPKSFKIKSYNFTSKSDMPVRTTGNYADNAMADPSQKNEGEENDHSMLTSLLSILSKAGLTVEAIVNGASLTQRGFQKVAGRMGVSADDARGLLISLRKKLEIEGEELSHMLIAESDNPRYSAEVDALFSVTVRDSKTGSSDYFGGSKGAALAKMLKDLEHGSPEEQALLATYMEGEKMNEGLEEDTPDFQAEIASDVTTFNFPWRHAGQVGTATAQCRGGAEDFEITVIDARDAEGEEVDITDSLEEALKDQAVEFIPEA